MMNHLSSDQISSLTIGAATEDERRHIDACVECAAKMHQLKDALSVFRSSVERWAGANETLAIPNSAPYQIRISSSRFRPLHWAVATVALILLILLPVYKRTSQHSQPQELEDSLLLEQVNQHLLRTVPEPMEPMMQLISNVSAHEVGGHQ